MATRSRSRSAIQVDYAGTDVLWKTYPTVPNGTYPKARRQYEASYCVDELHPLWSWSKRPDGRRWDRRFDLGGPFDLTSIRYDLPDAMGATGIIGGGSPGGVRSYKGPICAEIPSFGSEAGPKALSTLQSYTAIDSLAVRNGLGGTAISRCKPASPNASLLVAVVELHRDGIPKILSNFEQRGRINYFRSLGSNYLNVEFGWKPFVSDLRKSARAFLQAQEILEDLSKNSGKAIRRRYSFPTTVDTTRVLDDNIVPWPNLNSYVIGQSGGRHVVDTRTKKTWFIGEFCYRIPDLQGPAGLRAKARHLLGLDLTPQTLWDMTPWTWLLDWFGNTGDVLANVSSISEDDLVMRYGYLMQESTFRRDTTHLGVFAKGSLGSVSPTVTGSVAISRKTRIGASPYGFSLTWESFTPRQIAILASLGLTRRVD